MAESKTVLTDWQDTIASHFRAQQPGLFIQTSEEKRALFSLAQVIRWLGEHKCGAREVYVWSDSSYKRYDLFKRGDEAKAQETTFEDLSTGLEFKEFFTVVQEFGRPEGQNPTRHKAAVLVICDPANALTSATNVRALRETLQTIRGWRKTVILLGRSNALPKDLQTDITVYNFDLPSAKELEELATPLLLEYPKTEGYKDVVIKPELIGAFARACSGITEEEMRGLIGLSIAKNKAFDERAVSLALREKSRIVKRTQVLECQNPVGDMNLVGGLEHAKAWINEVTPIFQNPDKAKAYGLTLPSGVLYCGPSGSGKSLTARMLAAHWKIPLLRCDMGRMFGSLVGESESNTREMIAVAQAAAPCVLMMDEIEKGLGGDNLDGGTSLRVLASILTWLEEKPPEVFVVATANDITRLRRMPELLQRFSDIFFVDLPDIRARAEILDIHMHASGHLLPHKALEDAARMTRGYSGRELRNVVRAALAAAFKRGAPDPTREDLLNAAYNIVPTAKTMKESIDALREWCKDGRAKPAGAMLEDEHENASHGDIAPKPFGADLT